MTKKEIRQHIAALKRMQTPESLRNQSRAIMHSVEQRAEFRQARIVLLYHSLPDEVCTHDFIERWAETKIILLPYVDGNDIVIRRYSKEYMHKGSFGIMEPAGTDFTDYEKIDLAIIPGVAFDREGNRLGRGKGYYDRFLPQIPDTKKIGIAFPFQIIGHIPAEKHDCKMDIVIEL